MAGRRCLDAGASTGGFTDVLLDAGAAEVVAVDVGYGQLDLRLRQDPRVRVLDRTNVRSLDAERAGGPVDLTVADLSFISLRLVLPVLAGLTRDDGDLVLLVKPQFEAGREAVGRGGVVRDPAARAAAVRAVADAGASLGLGVAGLCPSPLPGPAGNLELFLHLRAGAPPLAEPALEAALAEGATLPGAALPPVSQVRRVGVVVHPGRPPAVELGKLLAGWADQHGIELRTLVSERGCVGDDVPCVEPHEFAPGLDLVVALGGDGTLLRALGMVLTEQVPALGVNAGRLGFLAEVEPGGLAGALDAVSSGRTGSSAGPPWPPASWSTAGRSPRTWPSTTSSWRRRPGSGWPRSRSASATAGRSPATPPTGSWWPPRPARPPTASRPAGRSSPPGWTRCC